MFQHKTGNSEACGYHRPSPSFRPRFPASEDSRLNRGIELVQQPVFTGELFTRTFAKSLNLFDEHSALQESLCQSKTLVRHLSMNISSMEQTQCPLRPSLKMWYK